MYDISRVARAPETFRNRLPRTVCPLLGVTISRTCEPGAFVRAAVSPTDNYVQGWVDRAPELFRNLMFPELFVHFLVSQFLGPANQVRLSGQ